MSEFSIIEKFQQLTPKYSNVTIGIGDDTAVIPLKSGNYQLITTDTLLAGVHFDPNENPRLVGRKALAVSLSDIAAMAGEPEHALISFATSRNEARTLEIFRGILELAEDFGVSIIGGDTNTWEHPEAITVTLTGQKTTMPPLLCDAEIGHDIFVTGTLGGSITGHHLNFKPRLKEAQHLSKNYPLGALTDISDGIATDLRHIISQSSCGVELIAESIPISPAASLLSDPLKHAFCDGEDFELCFTLPSQFTGQLLADPFFHNPKVYHIGKVTEHLSLIHLIHDDGHRSIMEWHGYEHASSDASRNS